MSESPDLYYQATVSRTRFVSEPPDPEDVGLSDYRRAERCEMERFLTGDEHVLVMGGISATNKTYLTQRIAREKGLAFYDVGYGGREYEKICLDVAAAADFIVAAANRSFERNLVEPGALILDEGMLFVGDDDNRSRTAKDVLKELLIRYPKLIILGGGVEYTSDEQSAHIAELSPADAETKVFPFQVKVLNDRQTKELVDVYLAQDAVYKQVSDLIAGAILGYFRFSRRVGMVVGRGAGFFPPSLEVRGNYRESFMPKECFDKVWEIQEEIARRAMEKIRKRISA